MSSKSEEKISVNLNGRSCSESSVGAIGFSDSRSTAQQYKQGKCDSAIATVCTDGDGDNGESTGDSDSCNSESELTGRKERRRNLTDHREPISHNNSDVHSSLVTTVGPLGAVRFSGRRPRVGFVDMEISDSCANKKDISKDLSKLSRKGTGSVRYTQPRLSLLGKPINYKMHKRDLRYRRVQSRIYNFLERPKFWYAFFYHIGICVVCIGALVLSTLSTIKEFEPLMSTTSMYLEPLLLLWLMVEYSIRIWASGCRSRYQGLQGRLRFAQRPLCIVDLAIIISTLLVIIIGSTSDKFAPSTLRGLRFFQILRMVRMDRRAGTWKLLASVIWAHRRELLTTLYIGFLGLLFSSYLVYLAEKDKDPDRFGTYADALWWGVVTLCTVGYGDVVPTTWAGKLIASLSAVSGIAFFALPAGILGSGFALKVQQQQRQKHLIRRRVPAALLIQSLWRCYAADENSMSIATWKPHMVPLPSPTQERPFKNNTSFVSRFSTKRKDRGSTSNSGSGNISPHSPMVPRRDSRKNGSCSEEEIPDTLQRSHLSLATGLVDQRVDRIAMINKENSIQSFCSKQDQSEDEPDLSPKIRELTETHKKAIRSLRKIKYFVARRKFREALRPYDVKDVIEQYSAGHVDMLGRVKSLQFRLDQILGKSGSKNKDVYESKVSLSSRIVKVERQVEDIESKLDLLIDLYKEDRKMLVQVHKSLPEVIPHTVLRDDTQQSQPKPRSILIDKQYTSEPSSPITGRHPKRFMQRNHSDLSSRIRKRVTYRLHSGPLGNVYSSPHFEDSLIPENTISKSMWEPCDNNGAIVSNIDGCYDPYETSNQSSSEDILQNNSQDQFTCDSRRSNINDSGIKEHIDTSVESSDGFPQCQSINESGSSTQPDSSNVESHLDDISFCDPITPESESPPVLCNTDFTIAMNSTDHAKHLETQMLSGQSHNQVADHVVLMPIGTTQALVADVTDV